MSDKAGGVQCPAQTLWTRAARTKQARYWEFRQFDVESFMDVKLEHKHLEYFVYQFQETADGFRHAHGLLRFGTKVKYACVHQLIGRGERCDIKVAYLPSNIRIQCMDPVLFDDPVEWGTILKEPIKKTSNTSVTKKKKKKKNWHDECSQKFASYLAVKGLENTQESARQLNKSNKTRRSENARRTHEHVVKLKSLNKLNN